MRFPGEIQWSTEPLTLEDIVAHYPMPQLIRLHTAIEESSMASSTQRLSTLSSGEDATSSLNHTEQTGYFHWLNAVEVITFKESEVNDKGIVVTTNQVNSTSDLQKCGSESDISQLPEDEHEEICQSFVNNESDPENAHNCNKILKQYDNLEVSHLGMCKSYQTSVDSSSLMESLNHEYVNDDANTLAQESKLCNQSLHENLKPQLSLPVTQTAALLDIDVKNDDNLRHTNIMADAYVHDFANKCSEPIDQTENSVNNCAESSLDYEIAVLHLHNNIIRKQSTIGETREFESNIDYTSYSTELVDNYKETKQITNQLNSNPSFSASSDNLDNVSEILKLDAIISESTLQNNEEKYGQNGYDNATVHLNSLNAETDIHNNSENSNTNSILYTDVVDHTNKDYDSDVTESELINISTSNIFMYSPDPKADASLCDDSSWEKELSLNGLNPNNHSPSHDDLLDPQVANHANERASEHRTHNEERVSSNWIYPEPPSRLCDIDGSQHSSNDDYKHIEPIQSESSSMTEGALDSEDKIDILDIQPVATSLEINNILEGENKKNNKVESGCDISDSVVKTAENFDARYIKTTPLYSDATLSITRIMTSPSSDGKKQIRPIYPHISKNSYSRSCIVDVSSEIRSPNYGTLLLCKKTKGRQIVARLMSKTQDSTVYFEQPESPVLLIPESYAGWFHEIETASHIPNPQPLFSLSKIMAFMPYRFITMTSIQYARRSNKKNKLIFQNDEILPGEVITVESVIDDIVTDSRKRFNKKPKPMRFLKCNIHGGPSFYLPIHQTGQFYIVQTGNKATRHGESLCTCLYNARDFLANPNNHTQLVQLVCGAIPAHLRIEQPNLVVLKLLGILHSQSAIGCEVTNQQRLMEIPLRSDKKFVRATNLNKLQGNVELESAMELAKTDTSGYMKQIKVKDTFSFV